ncbi:MAG: type II toxin-antitoxin system mRNA interferase toxin, RelE/StbE family [bacterium]|nr:type II toxin-antitoxin system mRNA interferase toxin, RelE/StbE family [bacterium]
MTIHVTPRFIKSYKKLPTRIQSAAEERRKLFIENPFNPQLKTHKLQGKNHECWSFWVTREYRIKFIFLQEKEILFLDIGTHDIYQ